MPEGNPMASANTQMANKVHERYERLMSRCQNDRLRYDRVWFRNCLFYIGTQWVKPRSATSALWKPRDMKPWIPRPVTNKFASHANTIFQVLSQKAPNVMPRAATDTPEDQAAAAAANRYIDTILKEAGDGPARSRMASWMVLTGNVFVHTGYDNDRRHGETFYPTMACPQCGAESAVDDGEICPTCQIALVPAQDGTGQPKGEMLPNGRIRREVYSPFQVYLDVEAESMDDVEELVARKRYPIDVIESRWGKKVEPDSGSTVDKQTGMSYHRALAHAEGQLEYGVGLGGSMRSQETSATVDQFWVRPCKEFPQGTVALFVNSNLINPDQLKNGLPVKEKDGRPRWTWHHFKFDEVPGRIYGRTPLDDVAPIQEQRNKMESLLLLMIKRQAAGGWLVPRGLGIEPITGDPGQIITYNVLPGMGTTPKPERFQGDPVATALIGYLEKLDSDMEGEAGTYEVLKGSAPPGVSAGTALRLLLERSITRFTPVIARLEEGLTDVYLDELLIFQQFATTDRMAKIQGPGHTWETECFSNADLTGNVDIIVEAGSAMPRSAVGTAANIQDLVGMGALNPQMPETQYKILKEMGSTGLLGGADMDIQQAERETYRFHQENKPPVINPVIDAHAIHLQVHRQWALTADFEKTDQSLQAIWMQHMAEHQMAMQPVVPQTTAEGEPSPEEGSPQSGGGSPKPQAPGQTGEAQMAGGPR